MTFYIIDASGLRDYRSNGSKDFRKSSDIKSNRSGLGNRSFAIGARRDLKVQAAYDLFEETTTNFQATKGTKSQDGKYTTSDFWKFRFVLPLKSVFSSLSQEEINQMGLYNTVTKVKDATSTYFARTKELALNHKNEKVKIAESELKCKNLNSKKAQTTLDYFKNMSLEDLEQLPDVQNLVATDKKASAARQEMVTAFRKWNGSVKGISQNDENFAHLTRAAFNDLLNEIDIHDENALLQPIRMQYAQNLIAADGLSQFIDNFEVHVKNAIRNNFGNEEAIRDDFVRAAALGIYDSNDHQTKLQEYFTELKTSYETRPATQKIAEDVQNAFDSEILKLVKGDENITEEMLQTIAYNGQNNELQNQPLYLSEFFNEKPGQSLSDYAKELEKVRLQHKGVDGEIAKLNSIGKSLDRINGELNGIDGSLKKKDIPLHLDQLTKIPSTVLTPEILTKILGKDQADQIANIYNFNRDYEARLNADEEYKALLNSKNFNETEIGLFKNNLLEFKNLEAKKDELEKARKEASDELTELYNNGKDESIRIANGSKINLKIIRINNLQQEIKSIEGQIKERDHLQKQLANCEESLSNCNENIRQKKQDINQQLVQEYNIANRLNFTMLISKNELVEIVNVANDHGLKETYRSKLNEAVQERERFENSKNKYRELFKEQTNLTPVYESNYRKLEENTSAVRIENTIKNTTDQYQLHRLSLYHDKISTLSRIVVQADDLSIKDEQQDSCSRSTRSVEIEIGSELFDGLREEEMVIEQFIRQKKLEPRLQALSAAKHMKQVESERNVNESLLDSQSQPDSNFISFSTDEESDNSRSKFLEIDEDEYDSIFTVNTPYKENPYSSKDSSGIFVDNGSTSDVDSSDEDDG